MNNWGNYCTKANQVCEADYNMNCTQFCEASWGNNCTKANQVCQEEYSMNCTAADEICEANYAGLTIK